MPPDGHNDYGNIGAQMNIWQRALEGRGGRGEGGFFNQTSAISDPDDMQTAERAESGLLLVIAFCLELF